MPKTATRKLLLAAILIAGAMIAAVTGAVPPARAQSVPSPPASARPGYWADTSCSEGSEPASSFDWHPPEASTYPFMVGTLDTCSTAGGELTVRDEGAHDSTPESGPALIYEAIGDSSFVGGFVDLSMKSPGGEALLATANRKDEWTYLESCDEACTTLRTATATIPDAGDWILTAEARCKAPSGKTQCTTTGVNAELSITRATVLQTNTATPEASTPTGTLTESPVSGTANIAFQATDKDGPGVYRVMVAIDGKEALSETPNNETGHCVAYGTYENALNFRSAQPCPQETAVRLELPTAQISNGPHLVEVSIEDPAGNKAVVYDRTIHFQNGPETTGPTAPSTGPATAAVAATAARGPANGSPASEDATIAAHWHGKKAAMTVKRAYGHSGQIEGRLTNSAGTPIVGAVIEASERPSAVGASPTAMPSTRTASDGSFSLKVPATDSATVQLAYRSHLGDPTPAATSTLTLQVPASIHLSVSPTVARVGETITLHGKLAGTLGIHGKHLIFEGRGPGEPWVEFHGKKAGATGAFSVTHTFKLPGPVLYHFRVICEAEPAFPFARGVSNEVTVWER